MTEKPCPPVSYYPPSPDVLEHFARSACEGLGPDYCNPDIMQGFASFMKTIAQICANNLNRQQNEFDNRIE